jgi:hypothetical protein
LALLLLIAAAAVIFLIRCGATENGKASPSLIDD